MIKVFLGGTCNGSTWRDEMVGYLTVDYFNPVVEDWTEECYEEELRQRKECDYVLYTITSEMEGFYSIAEVIDDSNKRPEKTLLYVRGDGFTPNQLKSLNAVVRMVEENGGEVFPTLKSVARFLHKEQERREENIRQNHLRVD